MVADRVYEYESESVLVPFATQAEALAFLLSDRGVKQKDLAAIAIQSAVSEILYPIHEPYLPPDGVAIYRGISGEQFHGSSAS